MHFASIGPQFVSRGSVTPRAPSLIGSIALAEGPASRKARASSLRPSLNGRPSASVGRGRRWRQLAAADEPSRPSQSINQWAGKKRLSRKLNRPEQGPKCLN